jgi:hypothetical protein
VVHHRRSGLALRDFDHCVADMGSGCNLWGLFCFEWFLSRDFFPHEKGQKEDALDSRDCCISILDSSLFDLDSSSENLGKQTLGRRVE